MSPTSPDRQFESGRLSPRNGFDGLNGLEGSPRFVQPLPTAELSSARSNACLASHDCGPLVAVIDAAMRSLTSNLFKLSTDVGHLQEAATEAGKTQHEMLSQMVRLSGLHDDFFKHSEERQERQDLFETAVRRWGDGICHALDGNRSRGPTPESTREITRELTGLAVAPVPMEAPADWALDTHGREDEQSGPETFSSFRCSIESLLALHQRSIENAIVSLRVHRSGSGEIMKTEVAEVAANADIHELRKYQADCIHELRTYQADGLPPLSSSNQAGVPACMAVPKYSSANGSGVPDALAKQEKSTRPATRETAAAAAAKAKQEKQIRAATIEESKGCVRHHAHLVVRHPMFEAIIGVLIIANALFLGVAMEVDVRLALQDEPPLPWEMAGEIVFTLIFAIELALRLMDEGRDLCSSKNRRWHIFDATILVSALVSMLGDTFKLSFVRCLRILRMAKILRLFRVLAFLRELRLMLDSLLCCGRSLFWAMVLLFIAVFIFASFLAEATRQYAREGAEDPLIREGLEEYHNGVVFSMVYLMIAICGGGIEWVDLAAPYVMMSPLYGIAFMVFGFCVLLGMLNVLTGIFVDSASNISSMDEELVIQKSLDAKNDTITHMAKIFCALDDDDSGSLTSEELNRVMEDEHIQECLKSVEIDPGQATAFFKLLDLSDDGVIAIDEFVAGCLRIKGNAKSLDLAVLMYEHKHTAHKVTQIDTLARDLLAHIARIERSLGLGQDSPGEGLQNTSHVPADMSV